MLSTVSYFWEKIEFLFGENNSKSKDKQIYEENSILLKTICKIYGIGKKEMVELVQIKCYSLTQNLKDIERFYQMSYS